MMCNKSDEVVSTAMSVAKCKTHSILWFSKLIDLID